MSFQETETGFPTIILKRMPKNSASKKIKDEDYDPSHSIPHKPKIILIGECA